MPWGSRLITVLQAEDLLPQNQYLPVTIIVEQAGDQGQTGRQQEEQEMPGHARGG